MKEEDPFIAGATLTVEERAADWLPTKRRRITVTRTENIIAPRVYFTENGTPGWAYRNRLTVVR